MSFLDRRGRRTQLRTLSLLAAGALTPAGVAARLGGETASVARRLRRYARRGWLGRRRHADGVRFALRAPGVARAAWLARTAQAAVRGTVRTASERSVRA